MSLAIGFLLMFIGSFMDNIRGPILPLLRHDLGLSDLSSGWFLSAGNCAAILALFALIWSLNRYRDTTILKIVMVATIALIIGIAVLPLNPGFYYGMGATLGASMASLGVLSNLWVLRNQSRIPNDSLMCALHMLYGVASMLASAWMGFLIQHHIDWRWGLLPVAVLLAVTWFLLSKEHRTRGAIPIERHSAQLGWLQLMVMLIFAVYVACEVTTSMWMATYLHDARGIDLASASFATAGFFGVMSVSRLLGFFFARPDNQSFVLIASAALPLVFIALGYIGFWWAFCLVGLYGPFFPVLMARVKTEFPKQWRSIMAWVGIAIHFCLAIINLTIGEIAQVWGIANAYSLTLWSGLLLVILVWVFLKMSDRLSLK